MDGLHFQHDLGGGVTLALWDMNMAPRLARVIRENHGHLGRWLSWTAPDYDEAAARAHIRRAQTLWAEQGLLDLAVLWEGRLVGGLGMNGFDPHHRSTHLGYWLAEAAVGQGLMTRSVRALVDDLLTGRGLNRVVIAVEPDNAKSRAIPERLGFRVEGVARQVCWQRDHFVDWVIYSMLAEEWPKLPEGG